jgi:hypothetical protein
VADGGKPAAREVCRSRAARGLAQRRGRAQGARPASRRADGARPRGALRSARRRARGRRSRRWRTGSRACSCRSCSGSRS